MKEKFWLVWCESGGAPTYKHDSADSAAAEAERLARLNPGREFHVLEWCGSCTKPPDVIWNGAFPVPF